jgi:uncharacterized protein YabN with tetrapyrrole methylase and pyrophosphatase domain
MNNIGVADVANALRDVAAASARLIALLPGEAPPPGGSLTVIGTGIRAMTQLTAEAIAAIASAEVLVHVIGEPTQEDALRFINPAAVSLTSYYADGIERSATYEAMVQHIVGAVIAGKRTVAAFYGHPGVFTYPSHEAIRRARAAGLPARMLAAVSAEDCLWADLGIDPGDGCQAYEATDFLYFNRFVDDMAHLLLWQVGSIGNVYGSTGYERRWFRALIAKLMRTYPADHLVTLYEAPFTAGGPFRAERMPLAHLAGWQFTPATTLYIPPRLRAYRPSAHNPSRV